VVVVDAGTEPWQRVEPLLARFLSEVPADGVVDLLTGNADVAAVLPAWCSARPGLGCERLAAGNGFRIRTTGAAQPSPPEDAGTERPERPHQSRPPAALPEPSQPFEPADSPGPADPPAPADSPGSAPSEPAGPSASPGAPRPPAPSRTDHLEIP